MFSLKSKLDHNLKIALNNKYYKNYRVLICCRNIPETIEKKIKSLRGVVLRYIPSINCICAILSPTSIERIAEYPQVDYIALDCCAILCGSSILKSNGVHFQEKYRLTGKNICIGIVDTGVYPHSDLLNPRNKINKFLDIINEYSYPYDDNGHGTFISGIICGSGHMSKGTYRGVAENSTIYCIKAFNQIGKAYVSDILYSIDVLIRESQEYNIKIICLPFELTYPDYFAISLFKKIFDLAALKNIAVIVPSGHNGCTEGTINGISILENCITVGGIDTTSSKVKAYKYSSSGPFSKIEKPDFCAACVDIVSTNTNTGYLPERNGRKIYTSNLDSPYTSYTGTSCAAAYVSGICALLYENNPDISFHDLKALLKTSCNLIDISKWIQGAGTIDVHKLLP